MKIGIVLGVSEPAYSSEELERLNKKNNEPITVDGLDDKNIVVKSVESGLIKIEGMYRSTSNVGAFSILPERMSKKHIRNIAKEVGIDMKGITINIDTNEELLRISFAGRADPENVGGMTFFPNAFRSREELIRTIFHER